MRILLINPNRYASPPVPPIGLEYLSASLKREGHEVSVLDLCFAEQAPRDIDRTVAAFEPSLAGITIRNVDSVVFHTNAFFLDEIREMTAYLKRHHGVPVLIGGSGLLADAESVLAYVGADCAVVGPAEAAIAEVLRAHANGACHGKIFRGRWAGRFFCERDFSAIDYKTYFERGAVAGFVTHVGCSSSCVCCLEANTPVAFREIRDVVQEIRSLADSGFDHFHVCDSEFNEDNEYAIEFCSALKREGVRIRWALYMKPSDFSKPLFRALKESGAYLITLSVDSWRKCPLYWEEYEKCVFAAKAHGMRVAVDFLTGFPYETEDDIRTVFDTLRRPLPDSINVNTYLRLYRPLKITSIVREDPMLWRNVIGATDDPSFIRPVFFNLIDTERLEELIGGDPLFRIEGVERGVNYLRVTG